MPVLEVKARRLVCSITTKFQIDKLDQDRRQTFGYLRWLVTTHRVSGVNGMVGNTLRIGNNGLLQTIQENQLRKENGYFI